MLKLWATGLCLKLFLNNFLQNCFFNVMHDTYKTIVKSGEGYFKDKGSKFHSYAFPVYSEEEIKEMKDEFVEVIDFTELDFENGIFSQFSPYETSFGITLNSIQDAIEFNNVHEGLHMGLIMAMRKLV